jgi:hypothetical protein
MALTGPFNSGGNPWSSYMVEMARNCEIEVKAREKLKDQGYEGALLLSRLFVYLFNE